MASTTASAPLLAGLALLVSGAHLAYALLSDPGPRAPPSGDAEAAAVPATSADICSCDVSRSEISALREELAALQRTRTVGGPSGIGGPAGATPPFRPTRIPPTERELAEATPPGEPLPKIQLFLDIPAGVKLSQRDDGTIEAIAIDPAVSGQEYLVYVVTESDETRGVRIRVP